MKKIISMFFAVLMVASFSLAASTKVEWDGSGVITAEMSKENSEARIEGFGNSIEGEFEADDDNYERIEANNVRGEYSNGRYDFYQSNTLQGGSDSNIHAWSDGLSNGFLDLTTDEWRTGNSLKANGYNGHSWSWSGTDEQFVGAFGGNYDIGVYAGRDDNNNNTDDAFYGLRVQGDDEAGIGTEKAGSNTALSASGISGDLLIRGNGNAFSTQELENGGHIEANFEWN